MSPTNNDLTAVSVIIPAYQEASGIAEALRRLLRALEGTGRAYEVLVVSDGSTDATAARARSVGDPHVTVIEYMPNRGKGHALALGVEKTRNPFVVFMDGDLDLDPSVLPRYLDLLDTGEADVVVGSKVHPESIVDYPWSRRVLSRAFRILTRVLVGLDLGDTQTGLKAFRRTAMADVARECDSEGFAFDLELLCRLNDRGETIVEAPVILNYDFASTVKVSTGAAAVRDLYRVSRWRRAQARARSDA
ncbi:MAG TPA: glycosyltransferase family 2 protein [Acidimicrobiia bacterium]|nr:glycosyltransferase family 2 protein [Acidimicrobiia bacterium]